MYLTQAAMLEKDLVFPFPLVKNALVALRLGGPLNSIGGSLYCARGSRTQFLFWSTRCQESLSKNKFMFFHISYLSSGNPSPLPFSGCSCGTLYLTQAAKPVRYLLFPFPCGGTAMVALMLVGPLNSLAGSLWCARGSRKQ